MSNSILKCFNDKNRKILLGVTLSLLTSLNIAYAQGDLNTSSSKTLSTNAQGLLKFINDPQNKNDIYNDLQTQNDTELVMFITKAVEEKHITDINKRIEFINSFQVSKYIKEGAINEVNQNITYSDYEKVSYGVYLLKKCNNSFGKLSTPSKLGDCYPDKRPDGRGGCGYQRSNICCVS